MVSSFKKITMWIISASSTIFIIIFCIANRSYVEIDVWPLPLKQHVQLFSLLLTCIGIGILWGGFATWLSAGSSRKTIRAAKRIADLAKLDARHAKDRCCRLEQDLRDLKAQSNSSIIS